MQTVYQGKKNPGYDVVYAEFSKKMLVFWKILRVYYMNDLLSWKQLDVKYQQ